MRHCGLHSVVSAPLHCATRNCVAGTNDDVSSWNVSSNWNLHNTRPRHRDGCARGTPRAQAENLNLQAQLQDVSWTCRFLGVRFLRNCSNAVSLLTLRSPGLLEGETRGTERNDADHCERCKGSQWYFDAVVTVREVWSSSLAPVGVIPRLEISCRGDQDHFARLFASFRSSALLSRTSHFDPPNAVHPRDRRYVPSLRRPQVPRLPGHARRSVSSKLSSTPGRRTPGTHTSSDACANARYSTTRRDLATPGRSPRPPHSGRSRAHRGRHRSRRPPGPYAPV